MPPPRRDTGEDTALPYRSHAREDAGEDTGEDTGEVAMLQEACANIPHLTIQRWSLLPWSCWRLLIPYLPGSLRVPRGPQPLHRVIMDVELFQLHPCTVQTAAWYAVQLCNKYPKLNGFDGAAAWSSILDKISGMGIFLAQDMLMASGTDILAQDDSKFTQLEMKLEVYRDPSRLLKLFVFEVYSTSSVTFSWRNGVLDDLDALKEPYHRAFGPFHTPLPDGWKERVAAIP